MNKKNFWIILLPFFISGCTLVPGVDNVHKQQSNLEQESMQNINKPDLRVVDIYYEKGKIRVQYCNDGTDAPADQTVELKIEIPNLKTYQDVSYQIPKQNKCINIFGVPLEDFGLMFNNGSTAELIVSVDVDNTIDEFNEENNKLTKGIILSELGSPQISTPRLDEVTQTTAKVSWQTNTPASTECRMFQSEPEGSTNINVELDCGYFGVVNSGSLETRHSVSFKNFQPGKTYFFMVRAQDEEGRVTDSMLYPIQTQAAD